MLGVVPQELVFDPFFTVRETLRLQSGYFGLTRNDDWIDEIMANLDLTGKADANMRQLSGGMKRRVLVAQALVHRPPVIVLDEPTAGVDVELRQTLWKFISRLNREGHTIILTTHYLEEAEALCDRIAMLKFGEVVTLDRTSNLLTQFAGLQLVLTFARGGLPPALELLRMPSSPGERAVRLRLSGYQAVEPILAACREAGCDIEDMEINKADLEDVFVQIMRREGHMPGALPDPAMEPWHEAAWRYRGPGRHRPWADGRGRPGGFPHPAVQGSAAFLEGELPDRGRAGADRGAVPADLWPCAGGSGQGL